MAQFNSPHLQVHTLARVRGHGTNVIPPPSLLTRRRSELGSPGLEILPFIYGVQPDVLCDDVVRGFDLHSRGSGSSQAADSSSSDRKLTGLGLCKHCGGGQALAGEVAGGAAGTLMLTDTLYHPA